MGKPTKDQIATIVFFCLFLLAGTMLYLFLPKESYSPLEKRMLAEKPPLSRDFPRRAEEYLSDHMPFRDFFLGLDAYGDLLTGQQSGKDIYLAEGGRLVEAPCSWGRGQENIGYVNQFAAKTGLPLDLLLIPSAGFYCADQIRMPHLPYGDGEFLQRLEALAEVPLMDVTRVLTAADFYRTDHHWTTPGAFKVCNAYLAALGQPPLDRRDFEILTISDFYGSTYCRSCLWLIPGETLELWRGKAEITVEGAPALFDMEKAGGSDKYAAFLGGNQSLVILTNPAGSGRLMVLRDSFGSSIAPFLAERFEKVVLVDPRYYKESVSLLCRQEGIDRVLVLCGLGSFLTNPDWAMLS